MEHKEMYYYNPKYPEYGIETLPLEYIEWISATMDGSDRRIYAVASKFNIETGHENEFPNIYHVYCPYEEDDDMFVYDSLGNRERILSFNRKKLEEWWQEDVRIAKVHCEAKLEELEKCIMGQ